MKKIAVFFITMILFLTIATNVIAVENIELKTTKDKVNLGEELIVSIDLNLDNKDKTSLYAYTAKLNYDKDVFEIIDESNFVENENWSDITYNKNNNKFALINKKGKVDENLLQIKLKVKENATLGNTTIAINSVTASDGEKDITLESKTKSIMVVKEGLAEDEIIPSSAEINDITEDNTTIEVGKNYSWIAYVLMAVSIAVLIFLIYYIRKSKEANTPKNKRIKIITLLTVIILAMIIAIIVLKFNKKIDVNNDGKIDYKDSKEVIEYLLEVKNPQEDENIDDKDVNNDGKITVTDIAQTVKEAGNQSSNNSSGTTSQEPNRGDSNTGSETNPEGGEGQGQNPGEDTPSKPQEKTKASITKAEVERYYVEKGQELKIKYTIDSNKKEGLKGITLENGAFYQVGSQNEDGTYTVNILIESNAQYGKSTIKPSIAMYEFESGSETVILDESKAVEYYVLKDKPSIENYSFDGKTIVKFNLKNKDNAIINDKNVQIVVKDENGTTVKTQLLNIKDANTEQGAENTVDLKELTNGNYTIALEGTFDLDDKANDGENEHSLLEVFEEKQIRVISKFTASIDVKDFKIAKENESKKAVVTFTCENTTNEEVEWVVVNGNRYKVTYQGDNTYTAEITDIENKKELKITDVVLKGDNQVNLTETKTYEIFKTKPTITDVKVNADTDLVSIEFKENDEDKALTALKAVLKDSEGNQVGDPIDVTGKTNFEFEKPKQAGKYTVEVLADFDCVDGEEYKDVQLNKIEFSVDLKVTVSLVPDSLSQYIEKEKEITLKYNITANNNKKITAIEINNKEEKFNLVDGNYEITLTVPSNYGEIAYSVTKIKFEGDNEGVAPEKNEVKIYVLKTAPTMTDFNLNKDSNPAKISFNIVNEDSVRMDVDAVIREKDSGNEIIRKEITNGTNEIELKKDGYEFKGSMAYELTFEGTYDLDDTQEPKDNEYDIADIFKTELFQLEIDAEITNCEIPYPYAKKGETVVLKYTIDSNTEIPVSHIKVNGELLEAKPDGDKYSVTYTSKKNYGEIEEVKADAIVFGDEKIDVAERKDKIQVLKRVPSVPKTYEIDENYDARTITIKFDIIDEDKTLKEDSTYVTLGGGSFKDKDGRSQIPVKVGTRNEVTFENVIPHRIFMIDIVGTYDLDTDELTKKEDNLYVNKALTRLPAMLFPASELEISNIVAVNSNTGETIKYLNKYQSFKLSFNSKTYTENLGDTSNSFYPVSIKIEDEKGEVKDYTVNKSENTFTTTEALPGYESAGIKQIKIKSVTLTNNEVVENGENVIGKVEVLKDKLSVENYKVDTSSGKAVLTYTMSDPDNSFVSGVIEMTQKDSNEVSTMPIDKTTSKYTLDLKDFKKYDVNLKITYDLDSSDDDENRTVEVFGTAQDVEIIKDYELNASDLTVLSVDKENGIVKLQFKAENKSDYKVSFVKVDGQKDYIGVGEEEKNTYTFEYTVDAEKLAKKERTEIKLTGVKLENEAELKVNKELKATIFKTVPTAKITKVESRENRIIYTSFNITDSDSTLKNIYVALVNAKGEEKTEKTLSATERETTFDIIEPGKYQVVIKADYEVFDGEEHLRNELAVSNEKAEIVPNAKVISGELSEKYPDKGETIDVTYEIMENVTTKPVKATINEKQEYDLTPVAGEENKYKISYKVSDVAGPEDIEVTALHFDNEQIVSLDEPYELQVDVLKAKPEVKITTTNLLEQQSVMFNIDITDEDGAMIKGTANVHEENQELHKGSNSMLVKVEPDTTHTLVINIEYDLDSILDDDFNKSTLSNIHEFTLVSDYELKINNLRAVEAGTTNEIKYVNKAQQLQLRFNSTNKTNLIPESVYLNDGALYNVQKAAQDEYYIDITANSVPGTQSFEIEQVQLTGGVSINKDEINKDIEPVKKPEIVVLKTKPTIDSYNSTNEKNTAIVTFNINDEDKALKTESKAKLIDTTTNREYKAYTLHNGLNTCNFENLDLGKKYSLEIESKYSLSEDGANDGQEILKTDTIEIAKQQETNFKIKNLKITERVKSGETVKVTFENALMSYKNVDTIRIDNVEYNVSDSKDDKGVYSLEFEPKNKGVNDVQVQDARIDEKVFAIGRPMSYTYEYEEPKAIDATEIKEDGGKAIIEYKLKDKESSIRKLTAYMKSSSGAIIAQAEVTEYKADESTINKVEMPLLKINRYSIELKATCDIGDGKTLEDKTLFERNIDSPSQAAIIENSISKEQEYVEKGVEVTLTLKINTNVDSEVKKIYINGEQHPVEKVLDDAGKVIPDTYNVKVEAPKESGVFEQKVTGIEIGSDFLTERKEGEEGGVTYSSELENNIVAIKVLRDTPTVTHLIVNEQNGEFTFKLNDKDNAIVDNKTTSLLVKKDDKEVKTTKINKYKENDSDYKLKLSEIGINSTSYPDSYNIEITSEYDRKPDRQEKLNIFQKIANFFTGNKNEVKTISSENVLSGNEVSEGEEAPELPDLTIGQDILKQMITLTGKIEYNLEFEDGSLGLYTLSTPQTLFFNCSTGTPYKVSKIIIDGEEFPVRVYREFEGNPYKFGYATEFTAKKSNQETMNLHYDKVILENGAALDINKDSYCLVIQAEPTFSIQSFTEDFQTRKVRIGYKFVDIDNKVKDKLIFTLRDSQGNTIGVITPERDETMVEFNIPEPPTSLYKLDVSCYKYAITTSDWTEKVCLASSEYKSSVTTSILSSDIKNRYPKKGETIEIIYNISSTRVILVDKEDHTNQDKAVSITQLEINGELYDVETLDPDDYGPDQYRIYYTPKNEVGVENIDVSKIYFSNGEEEEFKRNDQIDILKQAPQIIDYSAENIIGKKQIKFKFKATDSDNVILNDDTDIYAVVGEQKQKVNLEQDNELTFDVELDQLYKFEIKAEYDLDSDQLSTEGDDNYFKDYTIFERPFILVGDYQVQFNDIKTYNSKGIETSYFEKGEEIKLTYKCKTQWDEIYPETVIINNVKYTPERLDFEDNTYSVTLKVNEDDGIDYIRFNSVVLNSGNEITLVGQSLPYEVLKDKVSVENFSYSIPSDNDKVNVKFDVKDEDKANQNLEIEIVDENDQKITPGVKQINVGENSFEFTRTTAGKYFVSIYSTYDRDTEANNSQNNVVKERIHYEIITVNTRYIEMKDILDIELYTYGKGGIVQRVDSLSKDNLSVLDNCVVKVTMKDIPEFYSNIKEWHEDKEKNQLILLLEYDDAMVYTGAEELKTLEVTLDLLSDGSNEYQFEKSFKALVDEMRANPKKEITLTKDYDLSEYEANNNDTSQSLIDFEFNGKINGNGHRIYNAKKPLFNVLKGATIENLIIDRPIPKILSNTSIVAKTADNTVFRNVHVEGPKCNYTGTSAVFAIDLTNNSVVEKCSVTDLKGDFFYNGQQNSSIAVRVKASTIKDCYIQGYMNGGWHFNGGMCTYADKDSKILNNIFNVRYTPYWGIDQGGNACLVFEANALMQNNLCLVESSNAKTIYYRGQPAKDSKNNCQLEETTAVKNEDSDAVRTISKSEITADFFRKLEFKEDTWNIPEDCSISNLPTLKGASVAYTDEGSKPNSTEVYIPDYNRVSKIQGYDPSREIIYNNMYKLMPFYDAKAIVNDGNKISKDSNLATKLIRYVVPYNKEGKMVSHLTTENYNSLDTIKVVYKDGTGEQFHIDFDDYYGHIASYMISGLKIGYNYNRYVIDTNSTIVQELIQEAQKYDFDKDLAPLTTSIEEDSRLYKEHFENVTKKRIPEFVINTIVNLGYNPNFESDLVNEKIRQELYKGNSTKLKQLLFAYNYFTKWYDLDMQGMNIADTIMFHGTEMFDIKMTLENMATSLISGENSKTNTIANYYNSCIKPYTGLDNLGLFFDHFIKGVTTYKDGDEWFREVFKGGIYETVSIGHEDEVDYTIWDHFKKDWKVQRDILPLLTVPENSALVISSPTQVYYAALRVYVKNPNDKTQIDDLLKNKVALFKDQVKHFYTFAYDFWGAETINKYCDTQYDMRTTYTGRGNETVYNNKYSTEEPYHKYFIEAIDRWAGTSGGAYANGNEVFWNVIKMLDGGFRVATHETLHNQDSKIFMNGYGRRGGAEDYAAGFIQQYYRDGWVSPNIFDETPNKDNSTQNLHCSTVSTEEGLETFYRNYFRTNDFLDYIEAQAFFKLSNDEKAQLATQVSYPNADPNVGGSTVSYAPVTADAVANMNLNSMDALWDNRIMLRPGNVAQEIHSPGADTDSIFNIHWYQPHADNDRPDGANFKYNAWQMAGEKGFKEGLVAYYSLSYIGRHTNRPTLKTTDSIAIKYITGKETWREYKLSRYNELSKYFNKKGTYIDSNDIFNQYLSALKEDAKNKNRNLTSSTNLKRRLFKEIREATKDFTIDPFTGMLLQTTMNEPSNEVPTIVSLEQENETVENKTANTVENTIENKIENATENITENTVVVNDTIESKNTIKETEEQDTDTNIVNSNIITNTTNETVNEKEVDKTDDSKKADKADDSKESEEKDNQNTTNN